LRDTYILKYVILIVTEPNSFTGEDVCEFHVHGGNAIIKSLFSALSTFKGLKQAEPGEFSKR
jgi:tRNA U34 5-carboxymethylaminomethyl modifying GTPase MnmE/TrmE